MYFIGNTNHRGTYYFHSKQHNGWIVADLDGERASLHNKLALITVKQDAGAQTQDLIDALTDSVVLGDDGTRHLIDGDNLVLLLRDYPKAIDVLVVNDQDGKTRPYGKAERLVAKLVRRGKRRFKGKGYE